MKTTFGCMTFVLGLLLAVVFILGACEEITHNRAVTAVVQEQTEQVRIQEKEATERTRIIVDGNVQIAEIQADATKKTDFTFIVFWVVRALAWPLGIVVCGWLLYLFIGWYAENVG